MISFYPGPSQLHSQMGVFMQNAYESGILSANHRSAQVVSLIQNTFELFKQKQNLPDGYELYFVGSGTEAWEIAVQSSVQNIITHYIAGSFAQKWSDYSKAILGENRVEEYIFDPNEMPPKVNLNECLAIVHNETSTGSKFEIPLKENENQLIFIDAVSSMGAVQLPWHMADVWIASVQKAFGLPAGMGLLICSPKAINKAIEINQDYRYNSLINQHKNFLNFQTTHTPNVLGIYLLNRVLGESENIIVTEKQTFAKAKLWYDFFKGNNVFKPLIQNPITQSQTVIALGGEEQAISQLKQACIAKGFVLGNGYGNYKKNSFRIANFPAHSVDQILQLQQVIKQFALKP